MSNIFSTDDIINQIMRNYWKLDYKDIYVSLGKSCAIRVTKTNGEIWFELDQEPLMEGCYLFSSQDLKEVFDWCYDNLNLDILYY